MARAPYDDYDYTSYWLGREYENEAEKIALQRFLAKIPQKDTLIDIGGGFGRHAPLYAHYFKKCLLVDPSAKLLKIAQERLKTFPNIQFKKGEGASLPAPDNQFDVALLIRVIHHLPDPLPTIKETARILKPQGFLILEFANKTHFRAVLRAWLVGNFAFTKNLDSVDQRSSKSIAEKKIPFMNHHPKLISQQLEKAGFKIIDGLSVSNFRSPFLKGILPLPFLLFLESACQRLLYFCHFGPSIFLLASKKRG